MQVFFNEKYSKMWKVQYIFSQISIFFIFKI